MRARKLFSEISVLIYYGISNFDSGGIIREVGYMVPSDLRFHCSAAIRIILSALESIVNVPRLRLNAEIIRLLPIP